GRLHPRADVADPGGGDLVLDVAVVPGEALGGTRRDERARRRRRAYAPGRREEEPVRIREQRQGRGPEWVGRDHVEGRLLNRVGHRLDDVVLDRAGIWIQPTQGATLSTE